MAGKFTKLWKDPIRDALYKAVSGTNRDLYGFIAPKLPAGEIQNGLRVRGIGWKSGPIPKEIISGLFFVGDKQTKRGKARTDDMPIQYLVNILHKRGHINTPSQNTVEAFWLSKLDANWERETSNISRTGT